MSNIPEHKFIQHIKCANCHKNFKLKDGKLSPAISGIIQCPHCKIWNVLKDKKQ